MKERNSLTFKVVEVPAEKSSTDDLLDFIADILVRKWMEEESIGDGQDSTKGSKEFD